MNTPLPLIAGALLLWAYASGQWIVAALLLLALLLVRLTGLKLALDDRALTRATDLCTALSAGALAYFMSSNRMPTALYAAANWLPATTFPLLVTALCSRQPLRQCHVYYTLRRSRSPWARREVDFPALYFAMCLIAASVTAQPLPPFYLGVTLLLSGWLLSDLPVRGLRRVLPFVLLATLAGGAGYLGAHGLQRAQQWTQSWFVDQFSDTDDDPYRSRTSIGELGSLKMSDGILWRVALPAGAEPPARLRDGVFTAFDGQTWIARRDSFVPALPQLPAEDGVLLLSGERRKASALLPVPQGTRAVQVPPGASLERNPYGVFRLRDAPGWLQLQVDFPRYAVVDELPVPATDLQINRAQALLLERIPELSALHGRSERERLQGVERFFAEHFRYTLNLGEQPGHGRDLERFLLEARAGHCEYFATATVLMLRHLGIPARYVTGYALQEYSRLEGRYLVRQRHAHAWVEAWLEGRWREVDTTPATWLAEEEQAAGWWQPIGDVFSWAWTRFNEWRHGEGSAAAGWWLAAALVAYVGWRLRRTWVRAAPPTSAAQGPQDAIASQLAGLEQEFATLGYPRQVGETPRQWLRRLQAEGGEAIGPARLAAVGEVVEALYRQRYAAGAALRQASD